MEYNVAINLCFENDIKNHHNPFATGIFNFPGQIQCILTQYPEKLFVMIESSYHFEQNIQIFHQLCRYYHQYIYQILFTNTFSIFLHVTE